MLQRAGAWWFLLLPVVAGCGGGAVTRPTPPNDIVEVAPDVPPDVVQDVIPDIQPAGDARLVTASWSPGGGVLSGTVPRNSATVQARMAVGIGNGTGDGYTSSTSSGYRLWLGVEP